MYKKNGWDLKRKLGKEIYALGRMDTITEYTEKEYEEVENKLFANA